jgi:hypothetical protein
MKNRIPHHRKASAARSTPTAAAMPWANIQSTVSRAWTIAAPALVGLLASLLLLWGLSDKYLWQDEAATAVLATRMLRFGRPLAYDGVNLITTDHFVGEGSGDIGQRTRDPKTAVDYYIRRGELKPDSSWKWQPWGSFALCALSLEVLGKTTLAARLPFALCGIITVLLLYRLVLVYCNSRLMAFTAALLLIFNCYWILHVRQCRYYSVSSLFLMVTLIAYLHWQQGKRGGAVLFVLAAWVWFQCDYGTVWPVLAVLFTDAFVAQRRNPWRPILVGAALAAAIAPFAYYYELWGRQSAQVYTWLERWEVNLFNTNEYVAPAVVFVAALFMLLWRWKRLPEFERRLVGIGCGIVLALSFWIPWAAPVPFLRYVVVSTPIGCLLCAWVLVRLSGRLPELALLGAGVWIVTPWLSMPLHALLPKPIWYENGIVVRPELSKLASEVFGHRDDPNRGTVEWLRKNTAPTDEILINYEDVPLMFYLPNPIRGGIAAFRVEDDAKTPPNIVVLRPSVGFYHASVFQREIQRYHWSRASVEIPDLTFGNNPDPLAMNQLDPTASILIERRIE